MFSLFPSDWIAPKKPKWMTEGQPARQAVRISSNPNACHSQARAKCVTRNAPVCPFPTEEMLRPGEEINDLAGIDRMLASIGMLVEEDKAGTNVDADNVLATIRNVNARLADNLKKLKEANPWEASPMDREELIELLEMFVSYSKTLEDYFRKRSG